MNIYIEQRQLSILILRWYRFHWQSYLRWCQSKNSSARIVIFTPNFTNETDLLSYTYERFFLRYYLWLFLELQTVWEKEMLNYWGNSNFVRKIYFMILYLIKNNNTLQIYMKGWLNMKMYRAQFFSEEMLFLVNTVIFYHFFYPLKHLVHLASLVSNCSTKQYIILNNRTTNNL